MKEIKNVLLKKVGQWLIERGLAEHTEFWERNLLEVNPNISAPPGPVQILVIADTYFQYHSWCKDNMRDPMDERYTRYIRNASDMRGYMGDWEILSLSPRNNPVEEIRAHYQRSDRVVSGYLITHKKGSA